MIPMETILSLFISGFSNVFLKMKQFDEFSVLIFIFVFSLKLSSTRAGRTPMLTPEVGVWVLPETENLLQRWLFQKIQFHDNFLRVFRTFIFMIHMQIQVNLYYLFSGNGKSPSKVTFSEEDLLQQDMSEQQGEKLDKVRQRSDQ